MNGILDESYGEWTGFWYNVNTGKYVKCDVAHVLCVIDNLGKFPGVFKKDEIPSFGYDEEAERARDDWMISADSHDSWFKRRLHDHGWIRGFTMEDELGISGYMRDIIKARKPFLDPLFMKGIASGNPGIIMIDAIRPRGGMGKHLTINLPRTKQEREEGEKAKIATTKYETFFESLSPRLSFKEFLFEENDGKLLMKRLRTKEKQVQKQAGDLLAHMMVKHKEIEDPKVNIRSPRIINNWMNTFSAGVKKVVKMKVKDK
jgi:hypothetical protein